MKKKSKFAHIPDSIAWYLVGFADGEGSFNVSLKKDPEYKIGWHIEPSFNVSQRDRTILSLFKHHLGVGKIRQRKDGVYYYEVRNYRALNDIVVPFFDLYGFLSATKKTNFSVFRRIVALMNEGEHTTNEGLKKIIELRETLNDGRGRKRKYSLDDYNDSQTESSETARRTHRS